MHPELAAALKKAKPGYPERAQVRRAALSDELSPHDIAINRAWEAIRKTPDKPTLRNVGAPLFAMCKTNPAAVQAIETALSDMAHFAEIDPAERDLIFDAARRQGASHAAQPKSTPAANSHSAALPINSVDPPTPEPDPPAPRSDAEPNKSLTLAWMPLKQLDGRPIPDRLWAIRDRVPLNQAGLFSGEGGTGKSILELAKDVAHVTGKDWLDCMPELGPTFYIGAEDDETELHIRLATIACHYGTTFAELAANGLHVLCLLGQDATLAAATGKSGKVETTALYRQIYEAAGDIKPKNISVDTLSRAFAGSEIDRTQVYGFAMHMQALAKVAAGSVTVLSHPSLRGIDSGSGISGSTAWHGAFRFRQYLSGVKPGDAEQPDGDLRQLEFKKNQYGPTAGSIVLRYQRGLFLPEKGLSGLEKIAAEQDHEILFLRLLESFEKQGRNVSDKPTANSYAPTMFASAPEAKSARIGKGALVDAMSRLFATGKISMKSYGAPSRGWSKMVRN